MEGLEIAKALYEGAGRGEADHINKFYKFTNELPVRPGYNTSGKAIAIRVNQYKVTKFPDADIGQYDVKALPASLLEPSNLVRSTMALIQRRVINPPRLVCSWQSTNQNLCREHCSSMLISGCGMVKSLFGKFLAFKSLDKISKLLQVSCHSSGD